LLKIAFQETPDTKLEFKDGQPGFLIPVCYEFAKTFEDETIYQAIMYKKVSIFINDIIIPVDDWHITEVKEEDKIIIAPNIEGEDGGLIQIALGIILIVASQWMGPLAPYAQAMGVSLILGGVSNLIFQPDLPILPAQSNSKQTQTYNWSGIKTVAQIDTPIPIVYGTHPVGGNVISLFIESNSDVSYLNMLIALAEGEISGICQDKDNTAVCSTSDKSDAAYKVPAITIDDQPIDFYEDVEWWYRTGTNLPGDTEETQSEYNPYYQNIIPNFDGARIQYDDGREISGNTWTEYVTTKEVDQVLLNFNIPQLYNGEGSDLEEEEVFFKVQYSLTGDWDEEDTNDYTGAGTYRYEVLVGGDRKQYCNCDSYRYGDYKFTFPEPTYVIKVISNDFDPTYTGYSLPYNIKIEVYDTEGHNPFGYEDGKVITNTWSHTITAPGPYGDPGSEYIDYQDEVFFIGEYAVSLDHDVLSGDKFTISSQRMNETNDAIIPIKGKTKTGLSTTIRLNFSTPGMDGRNVYYIRTIRTDGGKSTSLKIADNLILESIIEVVNGDFIYPNTALLGLRIRATGQLSGAPPNIITLVQGTKVSVPSLSGSEAFQDVFWDTTDTRFEYEDAERTWDNSTYETEYTNNSILCVRDLCLNSRYGLGDYYDSTDFDTTEIITAIRECWKRYDPHSGEDYFSWWDSGVDYDWTTWWNFDTKTSTDITKVWDSSARTITITGTGKYNSANESKDYIYLNLKPITSLKSGQTYTASITLSGIDFPLNIYIYSNGISLGSLSGKGNGTHTVDCTIPSSGVSTIQLLIYGINGSSSFVIEDISLTKTASSFEHYHTWNGVLESGQNALTALFEMCDAFRCWPIWHSGKINFVMDRDTTPIQTLSVGNTENFSQSFTALSELPYRVLGQFTDAARKYKLRTLVSKSSMSDLTKINQRTIGLKGLTSKAKAERELKFKHAKATTCTHNVETSCGIDMLHSTAGDIINLQDDLPQWGHGGNIIDYTATNLTIDNAYTFTLAATNTFTVKYKGIDNTQLNATIDMDNIVTNDSLQTFPIKNLVASPCELSAFSLNTTGNESKKFRILASARTSEDKVSLTLLEHFSSLYSEVATLTTIVDNPSPLEPINPNLKPKAPIKLKVIPLPPLEGMGFALSAKPALGDNGVSEIVVQIDRTGDREFETISSLYGPSWATTYTDVTLKFNTSYTFRFFCKTPLKIGDPAEATAQIPIDSSILKPPTGIRVKGVTQNSDEFDDRDVTIIWNPVGLSNWINFTISGYKVNVYKNSISNANLLRSNFANTTEYLYTFAMNLADSGGTTPSSTLVFQITTLASNGWESTNASHRTVSNSDPDAPTGLKATPWMRGVKFNWSKNDDTDLSHYSYRTAGIVGALPIAGQTGTFTAGNRLLQWNASGAVVASAVIDSFNANNIYLSGITGEFVASEVVGEKTYGSELSTDGNCEATPGSWVDWNTPTTNERSNEQYHAGTYSRKWIGNSQYDGVSPATSSVTPESYYKVSFWLYGDGTNEVLARVLCFGQRFDFGSMGAGENYIPSAEFAEHTRIFQAPAGSSTCTMELGLDTSETAGTHYVDEYSVKKITNAALSNGVVTLNATSAWVNVTNTEVSRFLEATEISEHPDETSITLSLKAVDVYQNESAVVSVTGETLGLNVKSTDIDRFAIVSSKIFTKIPILESDSWSDDTPSAGDIQWNSHNLYYNGTLNVIASGSTSDKYIYWMNASLGYSTAATTHPDALLSDDDFIIAVNISGAHDLAWNAIANQVIGSAYIQNLAVQEAHIQNLAVTTAKINELAVTSAKIASLAVIDGHINNMSGDKILLTSNISINATTWQSEGIQLQYNSGNPRVYMGSGTNDRYFSYDATSLNLSFGSGSGITVNSGGNITMNATVNNPSEIIFNCATAAIRLQGGKVHSSLGITPITEGYGGVYFGRDVSGTIAEAKRLSHFSIYTKRYNLQTSPDLSQYPYLWARDSRTIGEYTYTITAKYNSLSFCSIDFISASANSCIEVSGDFAPTYQDSFLCGTPLGYWKNVYSDDFTNVADFYYLDNFDDLGELHKIKGSGIINGKTGMELIDDNTLPNFLLDRKDGKTVLTSDGKPFIVIKNAISHLWGCVKQLDNKVISLTASVKGRI